MISEIKYNKQLISNIIYNLIRIAATKLPLLVQQQLILEYNTELNTLAKSQLKEIIDNLIIAESEGKPICQDTGIITFSIEIGDNGPIIKPTDLNKIITTTVEKATKEIPLRSNTVNIFHSNTGTNVGENIPFYYWSFNDTDYIQITVFLKGGGCSNVSLLKMLNPGEGLSGIKKVIIEALVNAGGKGCPPYTVGIGLGGGEDIALLLAKKALMISPNKRNPNRIISDLEIELIDILNQLGIGIMGLGEGKAVLDVHILTAARHPASLPVGISLNCWALRYATIRLFKDRIELISHTQEDLKL